MGGLAVRLHVGAAARVTHDVDVVAMNDAARARLAALLVAQGWHIGKAGGWWRAVSSGRPLIDISTHPVTSPRTFDTMSLRSPAVPIHVDGTVVSVAAAEDLVVMKLLACREQDLVDLAFLAHARPLLARTIVSAVAADDIERRVSEGILRARHALEYGRLAEIIMEATGEPPGAELHALDVLLRELEAEGL